MSDVADQAVTRAIEAMYQRFGDELTVDEMARTAMYSKFHFSRMFRHVTGVSPGRFLSAVRFQEAKRLLASTSLSVAEISNQVGYSSLGTFSTRFKSSVGVTPTEYRRGGSWRVATEPSRNGHDRHVKPATGIRGEVFAAAAGECGPTVVGLFPDPVPHRSPVRCAVLPAPGPYQLDDVPEGTWYVLAHAAVLHQLNGNGSNGRVRYALGSVGRLGPITVRPGTRVDAANVRLRPMRAVDLPVLRAPFVTRPQEVVR